MKTKILSLLALSALVLFSCAKEEPSSSVAVTGIQFSETSVSVVAGQTVDLSKTVTVTPDNATNKTLAWGSSNVLVASVDEATGVVTAVKEGTCEITAKATDGSGVKAVCKVTVTPKPVPVTEIKFAKDSYSVLAGATIDMAAEITVLPEDATDKSVVWSSSDSQVATVEASTGVVTAVSKGTASIIAMAKDGSGVTNKCEVVVTEPVKVSSVTIKDVYFVISVDEQYNLAGQTTVLPEDAADKSLSWSSDNTAVATVSDEGVVTGVAAGTATITATAKDGSGVKGERVINVRNYGPKYYLHACNDLITAGGYLQTSCSFVLDETEYLTGTACHKTMNAGAGVVIHQRNTPQDPVNCQGVTVDNGVVVIHLYVGDAAKFDGAGGSFEFTSSGQCDVDELSWPWTQLAEYANGNSGVTGKKFKTGWNVIELPLSVAAPTGTTDLSNVNFYRMFEVNSALAGMELKVDTIYITYITK